MGSEGARGAAVCENCGAIHVVRIDPDGDVRIVGRTTTCGCGQDDYRILGDRPGGSEA